jgi:hypothetical protein
MEAMKFRVNGPEHSKQIQEKLFEMGYKWGAGGTRVQGNHARFLFAGGSGSNDSCITRLIGGCGGDEEFFRCFKAEEYVLTPQGAFVKREDYYKQPETTHKWEQHTKPPLGLKPKKIHDQQRLLEIIDAMSRYASTGDAIPAEWFAEASYLNGQLEGK